ncbi:DUF4265 domain-containing protein [Pseudomonas sp. RIT-PI-AD]|uniref:DUF4265 domain-containing protein n=1 Tax=Pseudomonas sp. RIT-PI-AD TaxID=3035294 RepID=UPI0021D9ED6F|nr:DUF4265 domain-containing protein [Pseudomonas sp. RIT-PI-AD]
MDVDNAETLNIYAEKASNGRILREEVLVKKLATGDYLLLASPGIVLNLAKGDRFRVLDECAPVKVLRAGNICVQFFSDGIIADAIQVIKKVVVEKLNGTVDGYTERSIVITVSVELGFAKIESVVNELANKYNLEWYYGNVYEMEDGVTPLNWWL